MEKKINQKQNKNTIKDQNSTQTASWHTAVHQWPSSSLCDQKNKKIATKPERGWHLYGMQRVENNRSRSCHCFGEGDLFFFFFLIVPLLSSIRDPGRWHRGDGIHHSYGCRGRMVELTTRPRATVLNGIATHCDFSVGYFHIIWKWWID